MLVGCSGWNYPEPSDKGGWVGSFYPDAKTRFLRFYSNYFKTAEMDSTFYEKFYTKMTKGTFIGIGKATQEGFSFSIKVPETVTHVKQMRADALPDFEAFLDKISPLKNMYRLGVILFQLPPSFTVAHFRGVEGFLDRLPADYRYALEFRHSSWETEGALELLKQYNIAAVMTDSPEPGLQYLSNVTVTAADHAFIRLHGRNKGFWYDYLYSEDELKPWVEKVNEIREKVKVLHVYFNNHYAGKAVYNALKFKEMAGESLSSDEKHMLERLKDYFAGKPVPGQRTLD